MHEFSRVKRTTKSVLRVQIKTIPSRFIMGAVTKVAAIVRYTSSKVSKNVDRKCGDTTGRSSSTTSLSAG